MNLSPKLEPHRLHSGEYASPSGAPYGAFLLQGPCGIALRIIASDGDLPGDPMGGWEHVSVSIEHRLPNWVEMCFVKDLFWAPEECVVQYHPPRSEYVNNHPNCLHMWKARDVVFPMPPSILVGIKGAGVIKTADDAAAVRRAAGL